MASSDPRPRAFFDAVAAQAQRAISIAGTIVRHYRVGDACLALHFAGPALLDSVTPALAHLACDAPPAAPDFAITLWDEASTGIPLPTTPWRQRERGFLGDVPASGNGVRVALSWNLTELHTADVAAGQAYYWVSDLSIRRSYERASPLKVLLHWWLRERGWALLHAGAVGTERGAVLLVGNAGSGKSTTALTCLEAGMHSLSDDRCLARRDPQPTVFALYRSAKLHWEQIDRFPWLLAAASNPHERGTEKALVYIDDLDSAPSPSPSLPLRALVLVRVAARADTCVAPVSRIEVLRELGFSTLLSLPGAEQRDISALADLIRALPCYRLDAGYDLQQLPGAIAALCEGGG